MHSTRHIILDEKVIFIPCFQLKYFAMYYYTYTLWKVWNIVTILTIISIFNLFFSLFIAFALRVSSTSIKLVVRLLNFSTYTWHAFRKYRDLAKRRERLSTLALFTCPKRVIKHYRGHRMSVRNAEWQAILLLRVQIDRFHQPWCRVAIRVNAEQEEWERMEPLTVRRQRSVSKGIYFRYVFEQTIISLVIPVAVTWRYCGKKRKDDVRNALCALDTGSSVSREVLFWITSCTNSTVRSSNDSSFFSFSYILMRKVNTTPLVIASFRGRAHRKDSVFLDPEGVLDPLAHCPWDLNPRWLSACRARLILSFPNYISPIWKMKTDPSSFS